jgi:hypothetical protein
MTSGNMQDDRQPFNAEEELRKVSEAFSAQLDAMTPAELQHKAPWWTENVERFTESPPKP